MNNRLSDFQAAKARVEAGDVSFEAIAALTLAHGEKLVADMDRLDRRPSKFNALNDTGALAAEYTVGSARRGPVLTINRIAGGRRTTISTHDVAGKRDARALAKSLGATPWNF